jgi:hypothetical protein
MTLAIVRTLVGALLFISANAAAATILDQYPQGIASSPAAGGLVVLAEHDMPMGKGGMGQSGGGTGMGHGGMKMEMDKMQPGGMPPTAAPQMGKSPQTSPVAPQCPPGTSLQMDANGQHLCK